MSSTLLFIADNDYKADSEGELSYSKNDEIKIINNESEWWYGEHVKTGKLIYRFSFLAPFYTCFILHMLCMLLLYVLLMLHVLLLLLFYTSTCIY